MSIVSYTVVLATKALIQLGAIKTAEKPLYETKQGYFEFT